MNSIPQMSLKQRALAAYEAAQEREAHEEAERDAQAKLAHQERLQYLCVTVLGLDQEPNVQSVPLVAAETIGQPVITVCEIDGLLFTCRDISEEYPRLIIYGARYNGGDYIDEPIFSLKYLGQELKNRCILGEIRDGAIRYAEEDYDCEQ